MIAQPFLVGAALARNQSRFYRGEEAKFADDTGPFGLSPFERGARRRYKRNAHEEIPAFWRSPEFQVIKASECKYSGVCTPRKVWDNPSERELILGNLTINELTQMREPS